MTIVLVLGAGSLAGCGSQAAGSADGSGLEVTTLRYQSLGTGSPIFPELADALGYLDGITLNRIGTAQGGPADIQATATGQVDFGLAFNSSIINLVAAGAKVKAVFGYLGTNSETPNGYYVLENSPIRSARDLVGKKVALNTLGAAAEAFLDEYLLRNGLTPDELPQVTRVVLPPANAEQALRQGQVDLAPLWGSLYDQAVARGGGVRELFSAYGILGDFTQASYVLRDDFVRKYPNTARRFVEASTRAIEWTQTQSRDEVIAVYTKYLEDRGRADEVPPLKFWKTAAIANKGGVIAEKEFTTWITWLEKIGKLEPGTITADRVYRNDLNPYASTIQAGVR